MTQQEAAQLQHGVYRVFWKDKFGGGFSLASCGSMNNGIRWLAPTNWTGGSPAAILRTDYWNRVERVELIEAF